MDFLEAGRIVKPCGLKGRIKVLSYLESHDILQSLEEVSIKRGEHLEPVRLKGFRSGGKFLYLDIEGIDDSETVKALVGCEIMIPAEKLRELAEDEYYWRDIVGMEVVTEDGHFLGRVETILPTGSNDVYVCTGGEREILLPAIADVVRHIDLAQRRMVVRLLEGL
jgi:16S rRNA processing protein RimM